MKTDYDEQGQVTKEYTPRGTREDVAAKYTYDILGRKIQSEIPQEKKDGSVIYQTTTTEYDNAGNVTEQNEQMDDDKKVKTEYTYDKQGNLVMVRNCLEGDKSQYVQYVYDIEGNKVRQFTGMTSPLTITVSELSGDADASSGSENDTEDTFSYAGKTYAIAISGKRKSDDIRETRYEYDGKNQLISYTDPEGRTETYTYDSNSNLTKTQDKNGNTQKNTYDYQNRLTEAVAKEKKTGKETVHTYTYNSYGEIATRDDTAFAYDDVSGQVTRENTKLTKNKDVVKNYTYDSAGNKSAFAVKVGDDTKLALQYTYDGESKLTTVTDEKGNQVIGYDYDMDGNLSERTVAENDMTTTYAYDYQNHLTSLKNQTGSAGVISEYSSEYLVNGQKAKEMATMQDKKGEKSTKTSTYTYDLMGRITKEAKTGSEDISYTYDSNNNRKEMTVGNKVTAYKYNKNDELLRMDTLNTDTEEDSVVIYKNDKNGNQLATINRYEIPSDKKDSTYVDIDVTLGDNRLNRNAVNHYNALNQLTQTLTKNYKVSFTYDAEGLRSSKTVNGEKTVFVCDGDQLVMELSEGGKVQKRYIRGNDLVYTDKGEGTEKQYYVKNPHGDVVQLTDESGKVIKTYEYDSFGNEVKPDGKDENPFRYCGEYYDKETEEIYLRARYYQPSVGRFISRDTYTGEENEPLSLHLYTYCENDGVNMIDPSGHWGKFNGKYVHQDLVKEALTSVNVSMKFSTSTELHFNTLNGVRLRLLLEGAILPDYLEKAKEGKKPFKSSFKKLYRSVIKKLKIKKNGNAFHGKSSSFLEKFKKKVDRELKKSKNKKVNAVMIGCALHSIQDYNAHSYVSDLADYKEERHKYLAAKEKLKDRYRQESDPYQKQNIYHSDWGKGKRNEKIHSEKKDNPLMHFRYDFRTRNWSWILVDSKDDNPRYKMAREETIKYIREKLKYFC